ADPARVVPASGSGASGGAASTINLGDGSFAVAVALQGVQPSEVTAAEIHAGRPGENGPLILTLPASWPAGTSDVSMISYQCTVPGQYFQDLMAGRTYVQVSTYNYPQGGVRGQLVAPLVYANSGSLNDPFEVTRAGGQCGVGGDATDVQTALGLNA